MLHIVWEFHVRPEHIAEFERYYGSEGDWAKLFRKSAEYEQTVLIRDQQNLSRYLTVDLWKNRAAFDEFKIKFHDLYAEMDRQCGSMTIMESCIGYFEKI